MGRIKTRAVQRSITLFEEWGWRNYWLVESIKPFVGKVDLYHIIDHVIALDFCTIGVQTCSADFSSHVKKIGEEQAHHTINWLSNPNRKLFLIGWRKVLKKRGQKVRIYKPRVAIVYLEKGKIVIEEKDTDWYGQD